MSAGGLMSFISTRFTLQPHLSVASSSKTLNWLLIKSLELKVESKLSLPTISRIVVIAKYSIPLLKD